MKYNMSRIIAVICAVIIAASAFSACGVDPNVKPEEETSSDYKVNVDGDAQQETEHNGFYAYGKGKTDPVKVGDTEVKVQDFAVRSYELAYMLAQPNFSKPEDMPLDAVVQYALAHVHFDDLYTINNKTVQYRSATAEQIKEVLKKNFGTDDFKITSSVLYNPDKKIFEMWIPAYGTNIYYNIDAVDVSSDKVEIITTFYNELARKTLFGRTTITVKVQDGKPVISSLKTE